MLIEAYVETAEQAVAAVAAGADRLELCGAGEGGVTPSDALVAEVHGAVNVPVHAMVRPRAGDFVYDANELQLMRVAITRLRELGARGVVFGVLTRDGRLDVERMAELRTLARGLRVVCHRAFDVTPDSAEALEQLVALGVDEVLTSGHAPTALEGAATLRRHVLRSAGRIEILAGGGVRPHNVAALVAHSGVHAVHARAVDASVISGLRDRLALS